MKYFLKFLLIWIRVRCFRHKNKFERNCTKSAVINHVQDDERKGVPCDNSH